MKNNSSKELAFVYVVDSLEDNNILNWYKSYTSKENSLLRGYANFWEEIQFIQGLELPLFYAVKNSDSKNSYDILTPSNNKLESLDEYVLFIRSDTLAYSGIISSVINLNGTPLVSEKKSEIVETWFNYINPDFLKRKIKQTTLNEICDKNYKIKRAAVLDYLVDEHFFMKTSEKSIFADMHSIEKPGDLLSLIEFNFSRDEPLIISQPLKFFKPYKEYRCWVVNDKVTSISRKDNFEFHQVPENIKDFANKFAEYHKETFPSLYVVDIAIEKTKGPLVIECNPYSSSGRFIQTDFSEVLRALIPNIDSQLSDLSRSIRSELNILLEKHDLIEGQTDPNKPELVAPENPADLLKFIQSMAPE